MHLPIIVASDDRFSVGCGVLMHTVLKHTRRPVRFYLFHSSISDDNMARIRQVVGRRPDCELQLMDVEQTLQGFPMPSLSKIFNRMIYARLAAPELLDEPRVVYLDTDTLVKADLGELYDWDLRGRPMAAVRDMIALRLSVKSPKERRYFEGKVNGRSLDSYFNSGVLVMDLEQFRRRKLGERAIQIIFENPDLRFPDQDALNLALDGDVLLLPERWNAMTCEKLTPAHPGMPSLLRERIRTALDDPAILHYATHKPWSPYPVEFRHEFTAAIKQTPWKRLALSTREMDWEEKRRVIQAWRKRTIKLRIHRNEVAFHLMGRSMFHWVDSAAA
jgi:lipopolysaccharide biosynthesis glycosyltransferase